MKKSKNDKSMSNGSHREIPYGSILTYAIAACSPIVAISYVVHTSPSALSAIEILTFATIVTALSSIIPTLSRSLPRDPEFTDFPELRTYRQSRIERKGALVLTSVIAFLCLFPVLGGIPPNGRSGILPAFLPGFLTIATISIVGPSRSLHDFLTVLAPHPRPSQEANRQARDLLTGFLANRLPYGTRRATVDISSVAPMEITVYTDNSIQRHYPEPALVTGLILALTEGSGNPYSMAHLCTTRLTVDLSNITNHEMVSLPAQYRKTLARIAEESALPGNILIH